MLETDGGSDTPALRVEMKIWSEYSLRSMDESVEFARERIALGLRESNILRQGGKRRD
jgi:hypothetical protein